MIAFQDTGIKSSLIQYGGTKVHHASPVGIRTGSYIVIVFQITVEQVFEGDLVPAFYIRDIGHGTQVYIVFVLTVIE
jgi:hypothetical protein